MTDAATRQARRRQRLRAAGMTQVLLTIPDTPQAREAVQALAKELRLAHITEE